MQVRQVERLMKKTHEFTKCLVNEEEVAQRD